jgi:hypothetical protein
VLWYRRSAPVSAPFQSGLISTKAKVLPSGLQEGWANDDFASIKRCVSPTLETHFVHVLAMMQPSAELLAQLPELVKTRWQKRNERAEAEKRQLTSRRTEQDTLNRKLIQKYVSGALSQEDFETLKRSITADLASIDAQLKALQEE